MRWIRRELTLEVEFASLPVEVQEMADWRAGKQEAFSSEAHWKERGLTLATK